MKTGTKVLIGVGSAMLIGGIGLMYWKSSYYMPSISSVEKISIGTSQPYLKLKIRYKGQNMSNTLNKNESMFIKGSNWTIVCKEYETGLGYELMKNGEVKERRIL